MAGLAALIVVFLHAMLLVATAASPPPCESIAMKFRMHRKSVRQGQHANLRIKVINKGSHPIRDLGVRIELPRALVPSPKRSAYPIVVTDGGSGGRAVYWVNMSLPALKHLYLGIRLWTCATAQVRRYAVNGTLYVVDDTTKAVVCLSHAIQPAVVRPRLRWGNIACRPY